MKKEYIYITSGILIIIGLMNLFLSTILFKNIEIELYDITNDVAEIGQPIINTLEENAINNAQLNVGNNGNSAFDFKQSQQNINYYKDFVADIIDNGKTVEECYNLNTSLEIDNCVKGYGDLLLDTLPLIDLNGSLSEKYNLINELCQYGQNRDYSIKRCIEENYIKKMDLTYFQCVEVFNTEENKRYKNKCFTMRYDNNIVNGIKSNFMSMMLEYNKDLYRIDNKGRIITKKVTSELIAKNPKYTKMFALIQPYYTDTEYLETNIKDIDIDLYNFLKEKVAYHNNMDNFEVFEHSTFFERNPDLKIK